MILRIDLAPDIVVKSNYREILPMLVMSIIVVAVGYATPIMWAQSITMEAQSLTEETQKKRNTLNSLQIDLKNMKETKEFSQELERRQTAIGSIAVGRKRPVLLLDKIQEIHLDRMWITSLELQAGKDDSSNIVVIDGWATDYNVIAEYIRRIKNINNKQNGLSMDAKDFVPKFEENNQSTQENNLAETKTDDPYNINITDIILDDLFKNYSDSVLNLPIQQFKLRFKPQFNVALMDNNKKQ